MLDPLGSWNGSAFHAPSKIPRQRFGFSLTSSRYSQPTKCPIVKKVLLLLVATIAILVSCSKDDPEEGLDTFGLEGDRLVLDVQEFPYPTLSEYGFFKGPMVNQRPVAGVLPYAPINSLFTDYAHKFRFVWMPQGAKAVYNGDHDVLDFPDGAVLIKSFYYDRVLPEDSRRIIETRLLFKRNGQWEFADYVWNNEQTQATLDLNGSFTPVTWLDDSGVERSVNYRIPSEAECLTCHKLNDDAIPIGPKPQNLNIIFDYPADRIRLASGPMNQLAKWVQVGYLQRGYPKTISTVPHWDDPTADLNTRVRAYVDIHCAHCHREGSHCDYRPMRFAFNETVIPANLGVCVPPDDPILPQHSHIVARGSTERSLLFYRISSTNEAERMPLLGRTLVHTEGVSMFSDWINGLSPACP